MYSIVPVLFPLKSILFMSKLSHMCNLITSMLLFSTRHQVRISQNQPQNKHFNIQGCKYSVNSVPTLNTGQKEIKTGGRHL